MKQQLKQKDKTSDLESLRSENCQLKKSNKELKIVVEKISKICNSFSVCD